MRMFRSHWEIKSLALVLAVVVFLYTNEQVRDDLDVTVVFDSAAVVDLPDGYVVTEVSPERISMIVNGPLSFLNEFKQQPPQPRLAFDDDRLEGSQLSYDITPEVLQMSPDMRLRALSSSQVTVKVDTIISRPLPLVVAVTDIDLQVEGIEIVEARSDQGQVVLRGPRRLLDAWAAESAPIKRIPFRPDGNLDKQEVYTANLTIDLPDHLEGEVSVVGDDPPTASITFAPAPAERDINVPVQIIVPAPYLAEYEVELHDKEVTLKLLGPQLQLEELKEDQITAYIQLPSTPKLDVSEDYVVQTISPGWLRIESDKVKATVRLRQEQVTVPTLVPDAPPNINDVPGVEEVPAP